MAVAVIKVVCIGSSSGCSGDGRIRSSGGGGGQHWAQY